MEGRYGRFLLPKIERNKMEIKEYSLRAAQIEDSSQLAEIASVGLPGYPFEYIYNPQAISAEILQGNDHRIVADSVGYILLGTAVLELGHPMSEIKRVVVSPEMRQNGIAYSMTQYLVDKALRSRLVPWSDVRADQVGMQRAALKSGLLPVSLEQGKPFS